MTYTQTKECIQELGREGLEDLIDRYGEDVIKAAFECGVVPKNIVDAYNGYFDSDADFAEEWYDSVYGTSKLDELYPGLHVDWEWTAKDLMMEHSEDNGHYFRCL